ncbi:DUF4351 domain-containing protein [Geminocystis sp. GBBB08]|uniref:DUF4351 domain-containing protein n=1 Tax=Geminocystis sp. GBBB08 TaxID=2604140 RepID=UPI0027E389D1|nr:DUF4351 domain-containing protein [Geminocystis sp. GBBB08]MBL1211201.1 DUF4351 domain-containing protein [Geminocystis sp. GBBB08]
MLESVIYQDILQKGEKRGKQIGELRGEQKEAFMFLHRLLNRRFGEIDSSMIERLRVLPKEELETLGESLFDLSELTDIEAWLNQLLPNTDDNKTKTT